jgi:SecD/SecF fusion protein
VVTGQYLEDASVNIGGPQDPDAAGQPVVNFQMTSEGGRIIQRATRPRIGERMAIILDGRVAVAPVIRQALGASSRITGIGDMKEAQNITIVLRSGALPAPARVVENRTIGPSLGLDSIRSGTTSAVVGLILVVLFMVAYYRGSGLIADTALFLNMLFILAVLAGFHFTLTLPGIAGIILTMGMAVDANVLIYDRIKEELRAGKTVRAAVDAGYTNARSAILDANITTLITAVVLYQFGTGPIRGFALTLSIGIVSSVFTALIVTRLMFDSVLERKGVQELSIYGARPVNLFVNADYDFLKARRKAYLVSAVMIVVGIASLIVHGGPNYSIDFEGGLMMRVAFEEPVAVSDLRQVVADATGKTPEVTTDVDEESNYIIRLERLSEDPGEEAAEVAAQQIQATLGDAFPGNAVTIRSAEGVGPKVGAELRSRMIWAIIWALLGMLIYISWRFEVRFAVASVVPLFHDVLVVLGVFSLLNVEISLPIVAALLTIVGYSLNDTIVVLDRVRENLKRYRQETYDWIINRAINDTLSRTVVTSVTTFIVVFVLWLAGGAVIHDFALALMMGVIIGTYSSLFVAAPILVEWQNARPQVRAKRK